jgi:hypothetical protein
MAKAAFPLPNPYFRLDLIATHRSTGRPQALGSFQIDLPETGEADAATLETVVQKHGS